MDIEILEAFKEETNQILNELTEIVERLGQPQAAFPTELVSEFSQKIDRVMGSAKTLGIDDPNHLGLKRIGQIAELCKSLGYKAAEAKEPTLLPIFSSFWADVLEVLNELVADAQDEAKSAKIAGAFSAVLEKRLQWLSDKVAAVLKKKGIAAPAEGAFDIEALLKDLQT